MLKFAGNTCEKTKYNFISIPTIIGIQMEDILSNDTGNRSGSTLIDITEWGGFNYID